ncbi:MAG: hypothetical protein ACI9OI_000670, partial [Chitinophagales bacterium]
MKLIKVIMLLALASLSACVMADTSNTSTQWIL